MSIDFPLDVTSEELDTPQIDTISVLEDMRMDVKLRNFTFPEVSSPISSFVVDYDRLHNGRPIKARYQRYNSEGNTLEKRQIAVPGGQYRVKVWAVHGGALSGPSDEVEYTVEETCKSIRKQLSICTIPYIPQAFIFRNTSTIMYTVNT